MRITLCAITALSFFQLLLKAAAFTTSAPKTISSRRLLFQPQSSHIALGASTERQQDDGMSSSPIGPITKEFILISDSTGMTAQTAMSKCLSQFDWSDDECVLTENGEVCKIKRTVYNFVRTEESMARIIHKCRERQALATFTFADPELRMKTMTLCEKIGVPFVDLMGPMLLRMADFLSIAPVGTPRKRVSLNNDYFRRVEAVEYTLKADDGQAPWLLKEADVLIVGVSRTGKTPLSVVLSQMMGWKVGNVPLVLEVPPPRELLDQTTIDPNRVFCLTINPRELKRIRETRLEVRGIKAQEGSSSDGSSNMKKSNYADRQYMIKDLTNAKRLCEDQGWTEIDVTGKAVEETAETISRIISSRMDDDLGDSSNEQYTNPLST